MTQKHKKKKKKKESFNFSALHLVHDPQGNCRHEIFPWIRGFPQILKLLGKEKEKNLFLKFIFYLFF